MVYDMIVPTSIDIMLPESTRAGLNTDDQKKAIDYMYGSMLDETKKVNIYDTLMSHNDEYLYFRTDHHWTALALTTPMRNLPRLRASSLCPCQNMKRWIFRIS